MSISGSIDAMLKISEAMLLMSIPICSCEVATGQQDASVMYSQIHRPKDWRNDERGFGILSVTATEYRVTR